MINVVWAASALKTVYENREHIMTLWDLALGRVLGPKYRIAFVGPGGIGKSVLLDYITGKALKEGYELPEMSRATEPGSAKVLGKRLAIQVVPGQDSGPQMESYDRVFDPEDPVDGVVFVAGFGFETVRSETARRFEVETLGLDTLQKFREAKLAEEVAALGQVLDRLRPAMRASRRPSWMLVAITKCDLFQPQIVEAEHYYAPYSASGFTARVNDFAARVGTDNFTWESLPVCGHLEDFEWNGEVARSTVTPEQRNAYIQQMIERLGELCR